MIAYYYTRDHLGSVREMLNSSGTIVARYSYDPYGRVTLVSGSNLATMQYAGYYAHATSGLNLTWYRGYDPNTGKWLSRDPIGTKGGINLYDYSFDDPINRIDLWGLASGRGNPHSQGCGTFDVEFYPSGNYTNNPYFTPLPEGMNLPVRITYHADPSCCKCKNIVLKQYLTYGSPDDAAGGNDKDPSGNPIIEDAPGSLAPVGGEYWDSTIQTFRQLLGGEMSEWFTTCAVCVDDQANPKTLGCVK